ncbi:MAG: phosphoribosylformylglycinamidine synthase subunit PurQ [Alphaproteobacteria bacterium]|nr:phosphoribosylformylglycinamidine synthase subunit PurQ [Alphaproteobacteria bacterium]
MKSAVITFPGSNCDRDGFTVLESLGLNPVAVWHRDSSLPKVDMVYIPGGFSYGDYLRSGAMAAHSPIMREVKKHADGGGYVLGVCNGFQILTETGLLPGILLRNAKLKFLCKEVTLKVENNQTAFTKNYAAGQKINIPIAHHDGNYFADDATLKALQDNAQIAFTYVENPNGSRANIAGIFNEKKNVLGMMPHPERHAETLLGGVDGKGVFESLLAA